jgi:quercetin dioxygenase-like cupin family protein
MGLKHFIIQPADRKPALNVLGTNITILASRAEVSDQIITLQSGAEGTGPPPHSHDWNESFYVSAGQIIFTCAGETTICPAGTFVHVPGGTVHSFSYGPDGGEMIEITGSTSNAIEMFTALAGALPPGPPDPEKAVQLLMDNGVEVHA